MGMIKRMKDMKDMVNAAPGLVAQAQQMGAQAQQMAAAQQAAMQARTAQPAGGFTGAAPAGPDFESIAGVSLDQFAAVSKAVAAYNYDQSMLAQIAVSRGIQASAWEIASQGWNDRIKRNIAVAQRFNQVYRAS
ncbi:MAG TPA: hypothetical protein VGD91_12520 [Trebonia sp.]